MSIKKLSVFIGRFRPLHLGHQQIIDTSLAISDLTLVLVGSANRPRTVKNPWTACEVIDMLRAVYGEQENVSKIAFETLDDFLHENDFKWMAAVHREVDRYVQMIRAGGHEVEVRLIGHSKDDSSYYLKKFPQWDSRCVNSFNVNGEVLDATTVRNLLFGGGQCWEQGITDITELVHPEVKSYLKHWGWAHLDVIDALNAEIKFSKEYLKEHGYRGRDGKGKSYAPIMTTADSVIIQSGHVLLGRRKFNPGKGLWALPGGFAHAGETIFNTSCREAVEETCIRVSRDTMKLAFRFKHVFSDPNRGETRGRIVTHAYLYLLNDAEKLIEVKADDDFAEVRWVPLGLLDPKEMYSDHFFIVQKMIDLIPVD
ncbi:cytidyltransferase [Burkholderia phage BcepSaruman]|uniref:Putative cytidyltransferase n=1 Tax=Burkholderia phage BcepSaruman TaxID=2530032 RepID=A0A4D5ZHI6_9CAUD|nr:cytidyltransferase [Burkholderia phage BcepSaruman]QBX06528.1 putative cytidyltransferase [Burkholderia phage BcepSaruman]